MCELETCAVGGGGTRRSIFFNAAISSAGGFTLCVSGRSGESNGAGSVRLPGAAGATAGAPIRFERGAAAPEGRGLDRSGCAASLAGPAHAQAAAVRDVAPQGAAAGLATGAAAWSGAAGGTVSRAQPAASTTSDSGTRGQRMTWPVVACAGQATQETR